MPEVNFEQTTPRSSSSFKPILLVLGVVVLVGASAYAGYWYREKQTSLPLPARPAVDFYTCQSHDDCVSVDAGHCGCMEMGKATAINKKYANEWQKRLQVGSGPCSQAISTDPTCISMVPRCVERRCQLVEKENFCGGITGKACPAGYRCVYDGDYPDAGGTCVGD